MMLQMRTSVVRGSGQSIPRRQLQSLTDAILTRLGRAVTQALMQGVDTRLNASML